MATQLIANDEASDIFAGLDAKSIALLLDVDGTLVDIGPSPNDVHIASDLPDSLVRLSQATGGALALVSGRPIADLDALFAPLNLPAVGGHGAELRARGRDVVSSVAPLSAGLRRHLAEAATPGSGIVVEDKGYSLALHYRQAPQHEDRLRSHIAAGRAAYPGEATEVLPGKAMLEVKRPNVSKGEGVRDLMRRPPFAGRMPVFIGDDVTDESVFAVLDELGGKGFSVGRHFAGLSGIFDSPLDVRRALKRLAAKQPARRP
jgi:trehalose 6-phosphate phosphatase